MSDARTNDVPVRDAATVVLLRDGDAGVEAWLLTRVRQMVFAGGMSVFPGGRVDPADSAVPVTGRSHAEQLGCAPDAARALVAAAVRETFEETGVLLSAPPAVLDARSRESVEADSSSFAALLRDNGLVADSSLLRPWARWITPEGEVRRYDTRFFVAGLPSGAVASAETSEASRAEWVPVADALEQATAGTRGLLPPTLVTLHSLLPFACVADVLDGSAERSLGPIEPVLRPAHEPPSVELPDGTLVPVPAGLFRR